MGTNYNERLAELIGKMEDRIYRQTAEAIRVSSLDVYSYYLKYGTVPILNDVNLHAARRGIEQLQRELDEKNKESNLTSLTSSTPSTLGME
ncbi:hypothetical protein J4443_05045 [Candidatus Woesearchaeota archaeon]|nr:hypothetical protein [Candidatus Woesearchaeota archaeon]